MTLIGKGLFGNKSVIIEPVQKLLTISADDLHLGIMGMGINEAGHDDMVRIMFHTHIPVQIGQQAGRRAAGLNMTVPNDQQAILLIGHTIALRCHKWIASEPE